MTCFKGLSDEKAIEEAAEKSGLVNADVATNLRNVRAADPKKGGKKKKKSPKDKIKKETTNKKIGKKKRKILGLIPGSRMIEKIINNIIFEFDSSNKVLWLYKP